VKLRRDVLLDVGHLRECGDLVFEPGPLERVDADLPPACASDRHPVPIEPLGDGSGILGTVEADVESFMARSREGNPGTGPGGGPANAGRVPTGPVSDRPYGRIDRTKGSDWIAGALVGRHRIVRLA
jgi:hypothetical protein